MKKSKLFTKLVLCIAVLICFSTSVNAESANVVLDVDESSVETRVIGLSQMVDYSAINEPGSLFKVYCNIHRSFPGKDWDKVQETLMDTPGVASGTVTADENANWKLELNPKGWGFIGCKAYGLIEY